LAALEAGERVDNTHLKIGPHVACYPYAIYLYHRNEGDSSKPGPNVNVTHTFYPIISVSNPDVKALERQRQQTDGKVPPLSQCVVLVKTTRRFTTVGEVNSIAKSGIRQEPAIEGLVVNDISSLTADEKALIQKKIPNIDFNKVLILEEGREPSSARSIFVRVAIGLALIGLGVLGGVTLLVMLIFRN
jgi:hypothetical protein